MRISREASGPPTSHLRAPPAQMAGVLDGPGQAEAVSGEVQDVGRRTGWPPHAHIAAAAAAGCVARGSPRWTSRAIESFCTVICSLLPR